MVQLLTAQPTSRSTGEAGGFTLVSRHRPESPPRFALAPGVRSVAAPPRRGEHSAAEPGVMRFGEGAGPKQPRSLSHGRGCDSMTAAEFRRIALSLPQAAEASHMGHPDFRVAGRIFATLGYPRSGWGMVKLTPEQQELFVRAQPAAFAPVKGGWGRGGATNVRLRAEEHTSELQSPCNLVCRLLL